MTKKFRLNSKNKGENMKGRKWFIAIVILLIIAAVLTVVFINLFREKDTKETINTVHHYVQEGYLNAESHENEITKQYLEQIKTLPSTVENITDEARNLASNAIVALDAFEIYGGFFDREIIYTKYTEVYRSNRKAVADNFSDAQRYINALTSYLDYEDRFKNILESPDIQVKQSWLARSWADCNQYVSSITTCTANAMTKLGTIYTASVTSPLMNNKLTKAIFFATKNVTDKLKDNLKTKDYTQTYKKVADAYLEKSKVSLILGVQYNEVLQAKLDKILGENGQTTDEYQQLLAGTLA